MRRDTVEIIAQILSTARQSCIQDVIMRQCGLSTEQWNRYRHMLLEAKLLKEQEVENANAQRSRRVYQTTEKGRKFLRQYEALQALLQVSREEVQNGEC